MSESDDRLFELFINTHVAQLESSGIPRCFWKSLCEKLQDQNFDAGDAFQLMRIDYGDDSGEESDDNEEKCDKEPNEDKPTFQLVVIKEDGIDVNDPTAVYLIDHTWTFRMNRIVRDLMEHDRLLERLLFMMNITNDTSTEEGRKNTINKISKQLWKYCQMYSVNSNDASAELREPIWYILDEVGCAITHSDKPNFRVVPFLHLTTFVTYSILFPIESCKMNDWVTRDFIDGCCSGYTNQIEKIRNALLIPWKSSDFSDEDFTQHEPDEDFFLSGQMPDTLPIIDEQKEPIMSKTRKIKVDSHYQLIHEYLTDEIFEIIPIDNRDVKADIIWYQTTFKKFKEFSEMYPNAFINQFPHENVLTIKDLLCVVCRRASTATTVETMDNGNNVKNNLYETYPKWLPTTYNLKTEIFQFISYYQRREKLGLDNHWIVKPWNLARGLDTYVTDDLCQIMRLQPTGPKIAQKYIANPVLFKRPDVTDGKVKFDIRYVLLLRRAGDPLEAYVYRSFFLRFANKPFELTDFNDYEKHFTVMNYKDDCKLRHIKCDEFINLWQEQYPEHDWQSIQNDICEMLNQMLICATSKPPPCGIGKNLQSRAMYAVDIMLEWTSNDLIQPKLLEVNYGPDCKRACEYYPNFFNDIIKLLFLNEMNNDVFRKITA